jgi:DNA-binding response OmpR family regulator
VIALTSDSMLQDKLEMFELWVDDYLTKPFEIEELVARLKSILKRKDKQIDEEKSIWNLTINYSKKKIYLDESEINFPQKQYLILEYLLKNTGYPQNKVKIMEYVWWEAEENLEFNSTTLESHIYAIRKVVWKDIIKTVKGIWYVIDM